MVLELLSSYDFYRIFKILLSLNNSFSQFLQPFIHSFKFPFVVLITDAPPLICKFKLQTPTLFRSCLSNSNFRIREERGSACFLLKLVLSWGVVLGMN